MAQQRVNIYVDGFNFYFGLKSNSWRRYYWIDIVKLFEQFIKDGQTLENVFYFSARPLDLGKSSRQDLFFQANKTNTKFNLILGKYLKKEFICNNCKKSIIRHEEKETDVRIATKIISDIVNDSCEITIIVSADSDLIPAIEVIRNLKPHHKVFCYFPPKRFSNDLMVTSNSSLKLEKYEHRFRKALLPESLTLFNGYTGKRPDHWK